jgi:hypothetical protein
MLDSDPASSYVRELGERHDQGPTGGYPAADDNDHTYPPVTTPQPALATSVQPVAVGQPAALEPARVPSKRGHRQQKPGRRQASSAAGPTARPKTLDGAALVRRGVRKHRSLLERLGLVYPIAAIAVIVVVGALVTAYLVSPNLSGSGGAAAFEAITNSKALAGLEAERQTLIDMNAAAATYSFSGKPKVVSPSQVVASAQAAANASSASSSSSSTATSEPSGPAPDPGSAEAIAYALLPSYGFSQSTQWGCLYDVWERESSWIYDAENPSGAYGIPQAFPASKMASAGPDYLTDPRTQIIWGLGYIQATYGTPCAAWNFELANGYY